MQTNIDTSKNNNIIVGTDYGQLIRQQTNSAIVEALVAYLLSKEKEFGVKTFFVLLRTVAILLFVKSMLEESKSFLDKFRFTNLNIFKYGYQWLKYSEVKYEIVLVNNKWIYNDKVISMNMLAPLLESKSIYMSQPGTYYYNFFTYLVKVIIALNKITFAVPKIDVLIKYIDNEIISRNYEVIHGGKTTVFKIMVGGNNVFKPDTMQQGSTFATKNYLKLKKSIQNNFLISSIFKPPLVPYCVNFDGNPGTGKTTFGSYIASCGIFNRIFVLNMVQCVTLSFDVIITSLERLMNNTAPKDKKIDDEPETVLIILDEVDKWLKSYCSFKIHSARDEARAKKEIKKDDASAPVMVQSFEKLTEKEEEEKREQIRTEFFDQLYRLVEGEMLPNNKKYVIIFNTNHFEKIFDRVDERFLALKDRFEQYKFDKNNKTEIIDYFKNISIILQNYNNKLEPHERTKDNNLITKLITYNEDIFEKLPDDTRISFRSLFKILRKNHFKIKKTVNELATYKSNSDTDEVYN